MILSSEECLLDETDWVYAPSNDYSDSLQTELIMVLIENAYLIPQTVLENSYKEAENNRFLQYET